MYMFCHFEEALAIFSAGGFLVLVDDADRENEGDLIVAAEFASAEKINFMLHEARGMLHFSTTEEHLERIGIGLIEPKNADANTPRFGLPFDALEGISTGISTADRAETVRRALDPQTGPDDFVIPGHILPLAARREGLAARRGHTEGSVELARLAGLFPAAVMSEVMAPEGHMARGDELLAFAKKTECQLIDVAQISEAALKS
jgi:3,4-dihydroxy 2-butanone 4-phosphate synthase / GTP cyclohydrolase II